MKTYLKVILLIAIVTTCIIALFAKKPNREVPQLSGPWFSTPFNAKFDNGMTGNIQFQLHPSSNVHWRIVQ